MSFSSSCSKESADLDGPTNSPQQSQTSKIYLADENNKIIAEKITAVLDGELYKMINGPYFILSSRFEYEHAFSTKLPMKSGAEFSGVNCRFEKDDCSGPCLIDANWSRPITNSLLMINHENEVQGNADRIFHYTNQPMISKPVKINGRLELFGFGPVCEKIDAILDNYFSLEEIGSQMPDLHNRGLRLIIR